MLWGVGSILITKISHVSEYEEINKSLYEWYTLTCSKNILPIGPPLAEKAREIAEQLRKHNCRGSNGWLDKWEERYNIKRLKVNGESGDVQGETVDSWKERLPEIIHNYDKDDVWNMDGLSSPFLKVCFIQDRRM